MTKNIKVVDSFFEQLEKITKPYIEDSIFGKEYMITNPDNSSTVIKRFTFNNKYELCFMKSNGKMNYEYISPNEKIRENIIEIVYYYDGKTKMISQPDNKIYHLKKGDIAIHYTKNSFSGYFEHNNISVISINLYVKKLKNDLNLKTVDKLIPEWEAKVENIFKDDKCIIEKANTEIKTLALQVQNVSLKEINDYFEFKSKIIQLFFLILKSNLKSVSTEKYDASVTSEKIKSVINSYPLAEIPTIKELCKIMKTTNYHLQSIFKNNEGMSIKYYILSLKMNHAKFLLKTTNYSIFDISVEVGYENPSKFAKVFKNYFGIFPSKYRKQSK